MEFIRTSLAIRLAFWFLAISLLPLALVLLAISARGWVVDLLVAQAAEQQMLVVQELAAEAQRSGAQSIADWPNAAAAFIIDDNGIYLAHKDIGKVGQSAWHDYEHSVVEAILSAKQGTLFDAQSGQIFAFLHQAEDGALTVVASAAPEIAAPWVDVPPSALALIALGLVLASIGGGLAVWIVVVRPLRTLTRAAAGIGAGDLSTVVDAENMSGELQVLAHTLNNTSRQLQELVTGLEQSLEDLKQAEGTVQSQAQQVVEIMNSVPEGMLLLGPEREILMANPAAQALTVLAGVSVGDRLTHLGERPLSELLNSPVEGGWHEVISDKKIFEVIARPVKDGPQSEHWVVTLRDVTREREAQRNVQQQERLAAVGQLAAGVAHDFNNILAVIVLYTEILLLKAKNLDGEAQEHLRTIHRQSQHAAEMIQQILDFSRRSVLERKAIDLRPFLKEQVKLLQRVVPENIRFSYQETPGDYRVEADPTRIQQAIMNLVINARDAMPNGGALQIRLSRSDPTETMRCTICGKRIIEPMVCIMISDTGEGISADKLPYIFEPFYSTKTPSRGSGLGLAQVYGIIKQHQGHIVVKSRTGAGSTFTLFLPALGSQPGSGEGLADSGFTPGQGECILVVEDEEATRQALADSLTLLDYRVQVVANGREALEVLELQSSSVDLVLSDVVMPDIGGIDLFYEIRERWETLPIVLISGHPMQAELEALLSQGLTAWLPKPPSVMELSAVIRGALEQRSLNGV